MKTTRINFATIKLTLLVILTGFVLTAAAEAATFTVDRTDDTTVQTCTAAANDCTLRGAIAAANAAATADVIEFDATIFNAAQTITLASQLTVNNNSGALTINGTGANLLTISGNDAVTVFRNDNQTANVIINALTITRGRGAFGGGIANAGPSGNLTMNNCVISFNTATNTGGGFNTDGRLTLNNSTVNNNTASVSGGGISNGGIVGGVILNNSTVSSNTAANGGGIDNGTFNNGSLLTLNNSTFSNNTATNGGAIRNLGASSTTTLDNTILANSTTGTDCLRSSGTVNASYSLIEANLTCVNGTNSNNLTGDPNLGALADNGGATQTHTLLGNSIAIDKGNSTLTTDQRGLTRPVDLADASYPNAPGGNGADIGAVELQLAPTAAGTTVGGRVTDAKNRGIFRALVTMTDSLGNQRTAFTNQLGFYQFADVAGGQVYVFTAQHRRYQFDQPTLVEFVGEEQNGINFTGTPFGIFRNDPWNLPIKKIE